MRLTGLNLAQHETPTADADPLWSSIQLQHRHVVFPYGLPVHVRSNHPAVIRVAEYSWGACQPRYHEKPIELRILVSHAPSRRKPPRPVFRAQSSLMAIVADAENHACCDLVNGFGFACLSKRAVLDKDYLRYHFVEAMAYTLLDALHLVIFHAACVSFQGRGFLLVGESGAGKSSLAYACARRNWTYISDDATAVPRRRPARLVVGNPRTFRFRPAARELFPEIRGPIKLRNGKPTIEIPSDSFPGIATSDSCSPDFFLFLRRTNDSRRSPALVPIAREKAVERLFYQSLPVELGASEERLRTMESLLQGTQVCDFIYSDLESAISCLEEWAAKK
jgi:hypothetical protein